MTEPYVVCTLLVSAVLLGYDALLLKAAVGVVLAVGVLFNQTEFLFGATIILFYAVRMRYPDRRTRRYMTDSVTQILAIGVGFLGTMAAVLLALASQGILRGTIYYSLVLQLTSYDTLFNYWRHVLTYGTLMPVLLLTGGVAVARGVSVARGDRVDERLLFVVLWPVTLSVPAARAFSGDHKFLFSFPTLALLAVSGLVIVRRKTVENRDQLRPLPEVRTPDRPRLRGNRSRSADVVNVPVTYPDGGLGADGRLVAGMVDRRRHRRQRVRVPDRRSVGHVLKPYDARTQHGAMFQASLDRLRSLTAP